MFSKKTYDLELTGMHKEWLITLEEKKMFIVTDNYRESIFTYNVENFFYFLRWIVIKQYCGFLSLGTKNGSYLNFLFKMQKKINKQINK